MYENTNNLNFCLITILCNIINILKMYFLGWLIKIFATLNLIYFYTK